MKLFNQIGKKEVWNQLLKETYSFITKILESDKAYISSTENKTSYPINDKTLLRTMGSWLGLVTLSRNKPITMRDLDIKAILLDAYESNKLDSILPFICKILTSAAQSTVFHQNNAWMKSILSLLAEISNRQETRITLKCEIEVLYKNLDIKNIIPSNILEKRSKTKEKAIPQVAGIPRVIPTEGQLAINDLPNYVSIDQKTLGQISREIDLKQIVAQAVDLAIK